MVMLAIDQGTLSIHNSIACTLINTSVTHSFGSKCVKVKLEPLGQTLMVETQFKGRLEPHVVTF